MAKVMNTKWFIDKNRFLIDQLYESRLGHNPKDLTVDSVNDPSCLKALVEMRLYRLPSYFQVPTVVKSRLQAQGALCYNLDDNRAANLLERELTQKFSGLFYVLRRHAPCTKCGTRRASVDGICYKCQSENTAQAMELSKVFNRQKTVDIEAPDGWYSPKTALMATEFGCSCCGERLKPDWLWNADLDGWGDGLCPKCLPNFPLGHTWSLPTNIRANCPTESYECCQTCGSKDYPYAMWSMCEVCYGEWQDRYVDPDTLYELVDRWGALSGLLIRSSADWITYLRGQLENKYCWNTRTKSFPKDHVIVPWQPKLPKMRSLKDAGVKLHEML